MNARERKACRAAFGEALLELGERVPELVVLDADISSSLKTGAFARRFPARHYNMGVAEQGMMMAAAGLAAMGLVPVPCTYATFASMRACEQVRSFICYGRLNVKIVASHGGIEVGWDGPTHQGIEDVAITRGMPNMTVVVPADATATAALLAQVVARPGPAYFRLGRNPVPVIYPVGHEFTLGRAVRLREGGDVTLAAMGVMVSAALEAAEALAEDGIQATVLDVHTVKPLDGEALLAAARATGAVVTAEDHSIVGGLGGAVAELLAGREPVAIVRVGVPDTFAESGAPAELFAHYGMTAGHIAAAARRAMDLRDGRREP